MGSTNTMLLLAESFVALTETVSPDKISVSDIIAKAEKNRKTFYYHFVDKDHLIRWIFRNDLAFQLKTRFDPLELVYEERSDDPCSLLPYYAFVKKGVRSLDGADFLMAFAASLESRRNYYAKLFKSNCGEQLSSYLYEIYVTAFKGDVRFVLSNRQLKEPNIDFLAEFYIGAFLSYLTHQATSLRKTRILEDVGPFSNIIHASLENEIKEQQLRRRL